MLYNDVRENLCDDTNTLLNWLFITRTLFFAEKYCKMQRNIIQTSVVAF